MLDGFHLMYSLQNLLLRPFLLYQVADLKMMFAFQCSAVWCLNCNIKKNSTKKKQQPKTENNNTVPCWEGQVGLFSNYIIKETLGIRRWETSVSFLQSCLDSLPLHWITVCTYCRGLLTWSLRPLSPWQLNFSKIIRKMFPSALELF